MRGKRHLLALLVGLLQAVPCGLAQAGSEQKPPQKIWTLRLLDDGFDLKRHRVYVAITDKKLSVKAEGNISLATIAASAIRCVVYYPRTTNRGEQALGAVLNGSSSPESTPFAIASLPVWFPMLLPFYTTQHHIMLMWTEYGFPRRITFQVGKGDYASFRSAVGALAGKEVVDVGLGPLPSSCTNIEETDSGDYVTPLSRERQEILLRSVLSGLPSKVLDEQIRTLLSHPTPSSNPANNSASPGD